MKRLSFLLSIVLLLFAKQSVQATSNVKVTTNSNGTTETHVRIETNGEVKSFDTKGDEDVDWTSGDGQSSVKINSNTKNQLRPRLNRKVKPRLGSLRTQIMIRMIKQLQLPQLTIKRLKTKSHSPFRSP